MKRLQFRFALVCILMSVWIFIIFDVQTEKSEAEVQQCLNAALYPALKEEFEALTDAHSKMKMENDDLRQSVWFC